MTIGERIKNRRTEIEMSQEELARKVGYKDRSTISYIERSGESISIPKLKEIAEALRTTPEHLMGWDEPDVIDTEERRTLAELCAKANDRQVLVAIQFMRTLIGE